MVGGEKEIEGLRNDRSVGGAETNIDNKGVIFILLISTDRRPGKLVLIPPLSCQADCKVPELQCVLSRWLLHH